MKPIIYCRKSSEDTGRQIRSLEDQERDLQLLCNKLGITPIQVFKESKTGTKVGRPLFAEMMKLIKQGKADTILCWKLDRLARNFADGGNLIHLLQNEEILQIITPEKIYLPTENVMVLAVEFGMANQYSRDLSTNVKRGLRNKLIDGVWPSQAPLGYLNDKVNKKIILDVERAKYIKRIFYLYVTERKSISEIGKILFNEGFSTRSGRKVYPAGIARILSTRFYTGTMERKGQLYAGTHAPLISKEVFDEARIIATGKTQPRAQTLFFPLRGFLTCDSCGCLLTATIQKGYHYYYCTNGKKKCDEHKKYLREKTLYPMVAEILSKIAFSQRKIDLTYRSMKEHQEVPNTYNKEALKTLTKQLTEVEGKKKRLLDVFLNESIDKQTYDNKLTELNNEKFSINEQITKIKETTNSNTLEPTKKLFELAKSMSNDFITGNDSKKHEILKIVLSNATIGKGKVLTRQYKSTYQLLANSPKNLTIAQMRRM